jgi:galactokinase/mevalonate kinase-like predicted kinase
MKCTEIPEMVHGVTIEQIPFTFIKIVDSVLDAGHQSLLSRIPAERPDLLVTSLQTLDAYVAGLTGPYRRLRMERVARIEADIWRRLSGVPGVVRQRGDLESPLDDAEIRTLKSKVTGGSGTLDDYHSLAGMYERLVLKFQREDLRENLEALKRPLSGIRMDERDFGTAFRVTAPLRIGISSANASDNHTRSKEKGAKTLNAGIDLALHGEEATPPLTVIGKRLRESLLRLRSESSDFRDEFQAGAGDDPSEVRERFFAYRRGGDEALRLVKQALVHVGIVRDESDDVTGDIKRFTGGGGLELVTASRVQQGSGLGTSSILAGAILKVLYRMAGLPQGYREREYPDLYDQSLLLEQSIGLNSGWQDARGAYGGPSAIKDFYAPPGPGLPAPDVTFLTEVDPEEFQRRVVLFNTGIARFATRGLNVVLDVYLCRDEERYPAIVESMRIHDDIVAALRVGDYDALGRLATRYWELRYTIDPDATNATIQYLFEAPEIVRLITGGLVTGAGGGGFALFVGKEGKTEELKSCLNNLKRREEYARSGVVEYRLNAEGITFTEM